MRIIPLSMTPSKDSSGKTLISLTSISMSITSNLRNLFINKSYHFKNWRRTMNIKQETWRGYIWAEECTHISSSSSQWPRAKCQHSLYPQIHLLPCPPTWLQLDKKNKKLIRKAYWKTKLTIIININNPFVMILKF